MKKLTCLLLAALLILSLAACTPPVDGPGMERPTDATDAPTDAPTEAPATEPSQPADPTQPQQLEPTGYQSPYADDPLNLMTYDGIYQLELTEDAECDKHVLQVRSYGCFLTMEHSLYQEDSLYAFWVEEFWPNEEEVFTDLYDARHGKTQSFSVQTADTAYEDAPQHTVIRYNDSGISVEYVETGITNYYTYDSALTGIHADGQTALQQLQQLEPCTIGEGPVGDWYEWTGYYFIMAHFGPEGDFFWMNKAHGQPVEIYEGAWGISEAGTVVIYSERLGSGTMPYVTHMSWEYDRDAGIMALTEQSALLLHQYEGYGYLYAHNPEMTIAISQDNALSYVTEAWGLSGEYQTTDNTTGYYNFYLPQFLGNSDAVAALNQDIRLHFGTQLEQSYQDTLDGKPIQWCDFLWEQYMMGDILAVKLAAFSEDGGEQHMAYYYDTANDQQCYAAEALAALGIDEAAYLQGLQSCVEQEIQLNYADSGWEGYEEALAWNVSADNLNTNCPFIMNEVGQVITYVQMETPDGTRWTIVYPLGVVDPESAG